MPTASKKPIIFISYAHADEPENPADGEIKWLSFVTGYLRPAIKHGAVELWIDRLMPGGAEWDRNIGEKLRACDIFILLVSRHSLSSDYVVDKEIAIIRERHASGETVHFYPLVLTPTPKIALDLVRDKNLRPQDGKPLSDYSLNERYRIMADAADEIAEIAGEIAARKRVSLPPAADKSREIESRIADQESLGAWLTGQSREVAVAVAVRAALRVAPLAARIARKGLGPRQRQELSKLAGVIFRALASARVSVQDRDRTFISSALSAAGAASDLSVVAMVGAEAPRAATFVASAAANSAAAAAAANPHAPGSAAAAVRAFVDAFVAADASAPDAEAHAWNQIRSDVEVMQRNGVCALLEAPLWTQREPRWCDLR